MFQVESLDIFISRKSILLVFMHLKIVNFEVILYTVPFVKIGNTSKMF